MDAVVIVAIVFGGLVLALAVVGGTILLAIQLRHGGSSKKDRQAQAEEASMIHDIHEGLSKMEKRIEVLETILMDARGRDGDR